jgi:hypothetical protein
MNESHPDRARIDKLVDGYFERMGEEFAWYADLDPNIHLAIDDAMLVTVVSFRNPDNDEVAEETVTFCTSARRYLQLGLLQAAIERQKKTMFYDEVEDDDDEEE